MFRSILRLGRFVKKYKGRLVGGVTLFLVARIFEASIPIALMAGIDRVAEGNNNLLLPVSWILIAVIARFAIVSWARIAVRRAGFLVSFDLRYTLYQHLQLMGSRFFSQYTIGDMMTRAVADISLIQRLISHGTVHLVIMLFASLVGFGFMTYLSPTLTLLVLPPLPFVFVYTWRASKLMGIASRQVQERLSDLGAHTQENLSGIRTIQAMVQEDNEIGRFAKTNQSYADAFYRQSRINSLMGAWMPTLASVSAITILGYGGNLVLNGEMTVGAFTAFFMYVNMVVQPFRVAGFIVNLFQRAAVASDRLFEVFNKQPEIEDNPDSNAPDVIKGNIQIQNLSFSYDDSQVQTLHNINLKIERGESIAIMGRIGSGKTTFLKQLVRLLDTPTDSVFIDGYDVRNYPLLQLRTQVALVPQDPFLFGEPLSANLTYDEPNRAIDQIWQAADSADFSGTVEDMPEKMKTIVGERGVTLSGGQKQRATLARGFIRHAPILVLDDCFSSVDTETEDHILSELKRLRRGQTTILVSHRVSTARHADRILIFDEGKIVEIGTHEELLHRGGFYFELERIQREGADENDYPGMGSNSV